jgi:hypothetical protein
MKYFRKFQKILGPCATTLCQSPRDRSQIEASGCELEGDARQNHVELAGTVVVDERMQECGERKHRGWGRL